MSRRSSTRSRLLGVLVAVVALALSVWLAREPALPWADEPAVDFPVDTDAAAARAELGDLTVAKAGSMRGYSRDKFPHWDSAEGNCNTREAVLRRDGSDVRVDNACRALEGRWHSLYDGQDWERAADLDIDHMVPLANAWRSGASRWSTERRRDFANDLDRPQLFAVTDNVNRSKGDQGPDTWKPPSAGAWCGYAISWIEVKHHYELSVTPEEKDELGLMLDRC